MAFGSRTPFVRGYRMELTQHSLMTVLHGLIFGGFFLLAIFGVVAELCRSFWTRQPAMLTDRGHAMERFYLILLVGLGWAAVLSGAYIVYPWYRAIPPAGLSDLSGFPQRLLLSSPTTAGWHSLGMEWKEHVAWMAPIAMTMVAYVLTVYKKRTEQFMRIRATVLSFAVVAFLAAASAGLFGAMLNKVAPVKGGQMIHLMKESK